MDPRGKERVKMSPVSVVIGTRSTHMRDEEPAAKQYDGEGERAKFVEFSSWRFSRMCATISRYFAGSRSNSSTAMTAEVVGLGQDMVRLLNARAGGYNGTRDGILCIRFRLCASRHGERTGGQGEDGADGSEQRHETRNCCEPISFGA